MNTTAKAKLDALISLLTQKLTSLKGLRSALDDETIAEDIVGIFSEEPKANGSVAGTETSGENKKSGPGNSKIFKKVKAFFDSRDNKPATLKEIIAVTKGNIHSTRQVLYKSAAGEFERHGQPGAQRETTFWLKHPRLKLPEVPVNEKTQ